MPSFSVLIVEPVTEDAEKLVAQLARSASAFNVARVATLPSAEEKLDAHTYDVILVDSRASDRSDVDAIKQLHRVASPTPIVMLTEEHEVDVGLRALKAGAQDYLARADTTPELLERAIRYAIERSELKRRVARSDRFSAMGQLAAGIAHEINNPAAFVLLNHETLRSLLERMREVAGGQEARELLAKAFEVLEENEEGIQRIRTLVSDLRSFARVDESALAPVDLNEVIRAARKVLANEIRHRASLDLDLGEIPPLIGDRGRLSQVVVNLLLNAVQAIEEGAAGRNEIRVCTRQVDGAISMVITDTGCGIPEAVAGRIFEPFFTTKPQEVGTGLGLAICAEVINWHGGEITISAEAMGGTRVEVSLPLRQRRRSPTGRRAISSSRKTRLLIIDDELNLLKAYRRTLGSHYDLVLADSGREALALIEQDASFDVVLCDLMMPDLDGLMLYKRIAESVPQLTSRLVFCTGGAFTQRTREFLESVPNEVLYKPITPVELRRFIARTLNL